MILSAEERAAIYAHAIREYPRESVGVLVFPHGYIEIANTSSSAEDTARPDPSVYYPLVAQGAVRALVHSHPDGPNYPSTVDQLMQVRQALPFGIVVTDGSACFEPFFWGEKPDERPPLVGRCYRHAVTDCYELLRDFAATEGFAGEKVSLPAWPRAWGWWEQGLNLYEDNFAGHGFVEVPPGQARAGDVLLFCVRWSRHVPPTVINHAGVLLESGLMLHHSAGGDPYDPSRLSTVEPVGRWLSRLAKVVRYAPHA